jgi:hypothetical protein
MIQGWCLSPARIHVQGASGSWIVLPCVPAARPLRVTGDRLRRQDDEPRPACTCVQKCQCHCGLEDPVGGMSAHFRVQPRCINMQAGQPVALAVGAVNGSLSGSAGSSRGMGGS